MSVETKNEIKVTVYICDGCGVPGLRSRLREAAVKLHALGMDLEIRDPVCMSACRFGGVVKVRAASGELHCYSNQEENGFQSFGQDPYRQLIEAYVPREFQSYVLSDVA